MRSHPPKTRGTFLLLALVAAVMFALSGTAIAEEVVSAAKIVVLSNDISNETTAVKHASSGNSGSEDGSGESNNGHGNNADGVDSSNPGQGGGGPNADGADSDSSVDDEAGGGGAAPSKNKGNGKNK